jgi:3-hydroxybutyryl-CoA dehydrogenase
MGYQIGREFALAGYEVRLNDLNEEKLQQALENIKSDLQMLMGLGLLSSEQVEPVMSRIKTNPVFKDVVEDVDVVIEAVFEHLELKQKIFEELDRLCPERTILVSNASTLSPSKLASATRRPDRVLVANYWNPTFLIPLVEIVRGNETSDEAVETIYHLLTKVGKKPVIENEPGYVGNRLQAALMREALSIVENGIATPQDVDIVIKSSFARRLAFVGPFEYFDVVYPWDYWLHAWSQGEVDLESSTDVPKVLKDKVEKGELGAKTGKGFYEWTTEKVKAFNQRLAQALVEIREIHQKIRRTKVMFG